MKRALTPIPSQAELLALLRYEPETGKLFWRVRPISMFPDERACKAWNTKHAGKEALIVTSAYGYKQGSILKKRYQAHRVIFKIIHGEEPLEIDHKDGKRDHNVEDNLRSVGGSENSRNMARRHDNVSGVTGVYWDKNRGKWLAGIGYNSGFKNIGRFADKNDAIAARRAAEVELGYHQNHGREAQVA